MRPFKRVLLTCRYCGIRWKARKDAKYCKPSCRVMAWRDRKTAVSEEG